MSDEFFKPEYLLALPVYVLILMSALFLHEMGHYLAARIFKIPIKDVVIGRGRLLKSWNAKNGVEWRLRLWPTGAHVHLEGIDRFSFFQKIVTIAAGPLINFAVVLPLFLAFYFCFGQPAMPNKIVGVEEGFAAYEAGLKPDDQFLAVEGIELKNYDDIWRIAYGRKTQESTYTIRRGDEVFDITLKPVWSEYNDTRGVPRANARLGIVWEHTAFSLEDILAVNGRDVEDNEELARELLIQNFDQNITINKTAPVEGQKPIHIFLHGDLNQGLFDEDNKFYDAVFLGSNFGNQYMRYGVMETLERATRHSTKLFKNIIKIPFQIFPIDKAALKDKSSVTDPDTSIINGLYNIIHLFAVASIAIGLINLLPFPNLDGGQIIDQILKKLRGDKLTNKFRANVFASLLLALYASMFVANMDNLHGYIDSRIEKVHEWIDQEKTN